MWKSSQWWLLTRPHAHLASLHPHTDLLELPDELYIPTLLRTHGRANETTCDWQARCLRCVGSAYVRPYLHAMPGTAHCPQHSC